MRQTAEVAQKDVTMACRGFHASEPGNDYIAYADMLLDIKTVPEATRTFLPLESLTMCPTAS